jgi:TPR repeat protein
VGKALGEQSCQTAQGAVAPLLVDMKEHDRAKIEVALGKQLTVVRYDCKTLEVIDGCSVDGASYGYVGFTRKERVLRLASADEIRANLPTLGMAWAAKLEGELTQGGSLDIALVTVGQRTTTLSAVAPAHLGGQCEGATHFVKRAYAGAFAVEASEEKSARAAVEIFGAGAEAKLQSSRFERIVDGKLDACGNAKTSDSAAPEGCGALLRVELVPLAADGKPSELSCPGGMVHTGEKCTVGTASARCKTGDTAACRTLCDGGDLTACTTLGQALLKTSASQATSVLKSACERNAAEACHELAAHYATTDEAAAMPMHRRACDLGSTSSCDAWATHFEQFERNKASPEQLKSVLATWQRACDGGNGYACELVALHYIEPDRSKRVVEPNEQRALHLLMQRCLDRVQSCATPAKLLEGRSWCELTRSDPKHCATPPVSTNTVARDPERATRLYRKLCKTSISENCYGLARLEALGSVKFEKGHLDYAIRSCRAVTAQSDKGAGPLECAVAATFDSAGRNAHLQKACVMRERLQKRITQKCAIPDAPLARARENAKKYCWDARIDYELAQTLCARGSK